MQSIDDHGLRFTRAPANRRILDLLATRYLVVDETAERLDPKLQGSLRAVANVGDVVVYENPQAFPPPSMPGPPASSPMRWSC